jgi:hypothetical protein
MLNSNELKLVIQYIMSQRKELPSEILVNIELGIWVYRKFFPVMLSFPFFGHDVDENGDDPLFLCGRFGEIRSLELFRLFRERRIPYLLIRTESWSCNIICHGEVLTEHCDENLDAMRNACEKLRERCSQALPAIRRREKWG